MQKTYDDLSQIDSILKKGGVMLCPTNTIWGLSCDAYNKSAVDRIFQIKERDPTKKLIILVNSIEQLKECVESIHPRIETLLEFCNRPLTVIYPASPNLPAYLSTEINTVGIRVTKNQLLIDIIENLGHPLVSTSANKQGVPFPKNFNEIAPAIIKDVDYTCYAQRNIKNAGRPSLIIRYNEEGELIFLR
ncbi:MAG: threonylcarbamoyl-AMP synthase [Saprospiraceae bacterium]|nr:threonylcarbamoyl-AMP synthase [Saprospiraceae bacterium]